MFKFFKESKSKLQKAFGKTRSFFGNKFRSLIGGKLDEETLESLEELFYEADFGVQMSLELVEKVKELKRKKSDLTEEDIINEIRLDLLKALNSYQSDIVLPKNEPLVVLVVGVNGNGKTSATAKLAKLYHDEGKKVLVGAADTFRAAAIEQLTIWADRIGIDIVKSAPGSDPASVVFDSLMAAKSRNIDVVIIDTAGRLHTKTDLMHELKKVHKVCKKVQDSAPHETLFVVDATFGQNALVQAEIFHSFAPITGVIATKLDGTAKGGILVAVQKKLNVPVKFISFGEGIDDFSHFKPNEFVSELFDV